MSSTKLFLDNTTKIDFEVNGNPFSVPLNVLDRSSLLRGEVIRKNNSEVINLNYLNGVNDLHSWVSIVFEYILDYFLQNEKHEKLENESKEEVKEETKEDRDTKYNSPDNVINSRDVNPSINAETCDIFVTILSKLRNRYLQHKAVHQTIIDYFNNNLGRKLNYNDFVQVLVLFKDKHPFLQGGDYKPVTDKVFEFILNQFKQHQYQETTYFDFIEKLRSINRICLNDNEIIQSIEDTVPIYIDQATEKILEYLDHYRGMHITEDKVLTFNEYKESIINKLKETSTNKDVIDTDEVDKLINYTTLYNEPETEQQAIVSNSDAVKKSGKPTKFRRIFNEWDKTFFDQFNLVNIKLLEHVMSMADYLGIYSLVSDCAQYYADFLTDKKPEEIRHILGDLPDDMSERKKREVMKRNAWCLTPVELEKFKAENDLNDPEGKEADDSDSDISDVSDVSSVSDVSDISDTDGEEAEAIENNNNDQMEVTD